MVTFVLSSLKTNSSGGGRKSSMILISPIGSSVYLNFFFINIFTFSPTSCTVNANFSSSVRKPYCQNRFANLTYTIIPVFSRTMSFVWCNKSIWIFESILSLIKRNTMLQLVVTVLFQIPFKALLAHAKRLAQSHINSNIKECINSHI